MATKRGKAREVQSTLAEFVVPMADVVATFVDNVDGQQSDTFSAYSDGENLVIVRHRRSQSVGSSPQGQGRQIQ